MTMNWNVDFKEFIAYMKKDYPDFFQRFINSRTSEVDLVDFHRYMINETNLPEMMCDDNWISLDRVITFIVENPEKFEMSIL